MEVSPPRLSEADRVGGSWIVGSSLEVAPAVVAVVVVVVVCCTVEKGIGALESR